MKSPTPSPMLCNLRTLILVVATAAIHLQFAGADEALSPEQISAINGHGAAVLAQTGAPSASIAIVQGGKIVFEQAYGSARIEPATPATTAMRYSIGSVSKQFTAAAVLMLVEDRMLSLDDRVVRWFPELTRAGDISVRQLLSMTSGYQDYWPQDYVFPAMLETTPAQGILDRWAKIPLDFAPGTKWQYSNTNYTIAGLIVEKVSGMNFFDFLKQRIFTPLKMASVVDVDAGPLGDADAAGYLRYGLGPLRPAPKEGAGWLFAAGQLAMTPHDLALWDISFINRTLLRPASYRTMQRDMLIENGLASHYGLGVSLSGAGGRRRVTHGGAVSGYNAINDIYPEERAAVVVLTNIYPGAAGPAGELAGRIAAEIFKSTDVAGENAKELARRIFIDLQQGKLDRTLFSSNGASYFSAEAIDDYKSSLGPLGEPKEFTPTGWSLRGGMTTRSYRILAADHVLTLTTRILPDGKIEQYDVARAR